MSRRLTISLAVVSLFAVSLGLRYVRSGYKTSAPAYEGMTSAEWECELAKWVQCGDDLIYRDVCWSKWLAAVGLPVTLEKPVDLVLMDTIKTPQPDAVPVLIQLLKSREPIVREVAAEGLSYLGWRGRWEPELREAARPAIPALLAAMGSSNARANLMAEFALRHIEGDEAGVRILVSGPK